MKHGEVTPDLVAAETDRVVATAASFRNEAVLAPSLCEGWSRGHVLAHLARNADALARVCDVALTGTANTMYDTTESRDADIAAGARRSADEQATDIRDSAARLAERLAALRPEHGEVRVERTPGGFPVPVGMVPFMRLRELVYHHVDLDAGFTFAKAPDEVVALFLRDAANRLSKEDTPPSLRIATTEGDAYVVGDGATTVSGSRAAVLMWLARGHTDEVDFDGPVPTLPFGG
ncbi:maleylpyruvate isomerase family mycothiol-dependent enzyme [Terrabacter sp. 2RAF25]|uniref:maleylpyruvate isomerase family mycothiol-dependent enzyme n=1 Tax=Terrabacter sp. 2RAF25 TaxID=3232998 RepID=UPI003F96E56F